jgi:hypothetical protein
MVAWKMYKLKDIEIANNAMEKEVRTFKSAQNVKGRVLS